MKMKTANQIILGIFFLFAFPNAVWAYIDPGSISIFMQVVLAFALGVLITARQKVLHWIRLFKDLIFSKGKKEGEGTDNDNRE